MEEIEVNIKLESNKHIYNLPIRKSEIILKLKEYCQIISNIPQDQQILIYKGKILLNEKFIKDYDIENNDEIILVNKGEQKPANFLQFLDILNNKKEINPKEIAKSFGQFPDILSLYEKIDFDKCDNFFRLCGLGNLSDDIMPKIHEIKELLKDPSARDIVKNINIDTSFIEESFNDQEIKNKIQNNPLLKLHFQNPQRFCTPQSFQFLQNAFKAEEKNAIESSSTGISVPPDPFGSLNNNQNIQIMNSSEQISNINSFNNNSIKNKEISGNNGIDIDYNKEYKDQMSQLKDMGFTNEESNIKALKQSKGNIDNSIEILLKYN